MKGTSRHMNVGWHSTTRQNEGKVGTFIEARSRDLLGVDRPQSVAGQETITNKKNSKCIRPSSRLFLRCTKKKKAMGNIRTPQGGTTPHAIIRFIFTESSVFPQRGVGERSSLSGKQKGELLWGSELLPKHRRQTSGAIPTPFSSRGIFAPPPLARSVDKQWPQIPRNGDNRWVSGKKRKIVRRKVKATTRSLEKITKAALRKTLRSPVTSVSAYAYFSGVPSSSPSGVSTPRGTPLSMR